MLSKMKDVRNIVIALLLLVIAVRFLWPSPPPEIAEPIITTITKTDTVFTDVVTEVPVYVPQYIDRVVTETVYLPPHIDTLKVIEDYYATYIYNDTLAVDTLGFGYLEDTVTQNRIVSRKINWDYKIPIITNTIETTIQLPPIKRTELYLGLTANGDANGMNYFGSNIGIKTQRNTFFHVGVGLSNWSGIGVNVGMHYKIANFPRLPRFLR